MTEMERMGAAAKERIETEFGLSQMLRRYAELYRKLHRQERRCV